jgi:hypothetical protein
LQLCNSTAVAMAHRVPGNNSNSGSWRALTSPAPRRATSTRLPFRPGIALRKVLLEPPKPGGRIAIVDRNVPFAIGEQRVKLGKAVGAEARVG